VPPRSPLAFNRLKRLGFFSIGLVLFYAPFALLVRTFGVLFPASTAGTSISDVHSACLRMPLGWLTQPWMWPTLGSSPIAWLPIAVLPLAAVALGPLFCGWLCPAGALPEYLGRTVPDRFKFDFKDRVDIVPLRYGFFAGILFVPFVSSSICCSLCNFNQMQNLVSGVFGNFSGFAYFSTMGVIAATVWIVPLGLFTKGGRGWCLFLCPAGTLMGFASWASARLPWAFRVRSSASACTSCGTCEDVCPMRATTAVEDEAPTINSHLCIQCRDCVNACPSGALEYRKPS
jgi:ferredoxin-type protein NapH